MPLFARELDVARAAAMQAGEIIAGYYGRDDVETMIKADDSPVTRADLEANDAILAHLRKHFPQDAILSEEGVDDGSRLGQARSWIVDPLDGTRDFVNRSGDFAVLIGLSIDGKPRVGVTYKPVGKLMYWAVEGQGSFVAGNGQTNRLAVSSRSELSSLRIGISRFAIDQTTRDFMDTSGLSDNIAPIGACIKMMAVARGDVEVSLCLNDKEKEWDTCAPSLIVTEAGGTVTDLNGDAFTYNRSEVKHGAGILMSNGPCHARLLDLARPFLITTDDSTSAGARA